MIRTDVLAGLSARQRLRKEREEARYIQSCQGELYADPEALKIVGNTFAGTDVIDPRKMRPFDWSTPLDRLDVVICARLDLEHPLYFRDNKFANCADCGCDLQYRPHLPSGAPKMCLCCAARRLRENGGDWPNA
jgi:hypothetical protein